MTFRLPAYLRWRDGRPRWVPGPRLRPTWRERDLKDDAGQWLGLEAAIDAADKLNADVAAWRSGVRTGRLAEGVSVRTSKAPSRTVEHLLRIYREAPRFLKLADVTRSDYLQKLDIFVAKFGDIPVAALTKADLYTWWEQIYAARGHAMANGIVACVRAMLSYGELKGWITVNPAKALGLEKLSPRVVVWTPAEVEASVAKADALGLHGVGDAIVIGLHTGQRQGDVLHFEWLSADHGRSRFQQSKTKARVSVPHTDQLAARIEAIKARRRAGAVAELKLTGELVRDSKGRHYTKENFGRDFRAVRLAVAGDQLSAGANEASILGKQYLDLRDTAITRLALAECTVAEIRAITGHSLDTIHKVLAHYLALDDRMADAAIARLKAWMAAEGIAI